MHSFLVQMSTLKDGLSFGVGNPICHAPEESAASEKTPQGVLIETSDLGTEVPQNCTVAFRCNTILSENNDGKENVVFEGIPHPKKRKKEKK